MLLASMPDEPWNETDDLLWRSLQIVSASGDLLEMADGARPTRFLKADI
jgi:hypothetical protein